MPITLVLAPVMSAGANCPPVIPPLMGPATLDATRGITIEGVAPAGGVAYIRIGPRTDDFGRSIVRRPLESYMREGSSAELRVGRTEYGEGQPTPEASNLRGQVVQLFDQAGVVTTDDYDFKGNLLSTNAGRIFRRSGGRSTARPCPLAPPKRTARHSSRSAAGDAGSRCRRPRARKRRR